jgi:hypothetical protein
MKHTGKRWRERSKSATGMVISEFKFTGRFLRDLMETGQLESDANINRMFATGFADAQHVPPMIMYLRVVAELSSVAPIKFGDKEAAFILGDHCWCAFRDSMALIKLCMLVHKELKILSSFARSYATLLADKQPTLSEHMFNVSKMAHMAFAIYRRNGTKFIANQTYANLQRLLRSIYWSLAIAQAENISEYFIFLVLCLIVV